MSVAVSWSHGISNFRHQELPIWTFLTSSEYYDESCGIVAYLWCKLSPASNIFSLKQCYLIPWRVYVLRLLERLIIYYFLSSLWTHFVLRVIFKFQMEWRNSRSGATLVTRDLLKVKIVFYNEYGKRGRKWRMGHMWTTSF